MSIKSYIPNAVTLLNLLSGCIAVVFAVNSDFLGAAVFMSLGIFFDFFDGLLARKLDVQSDLGIQLDSLADMVTSGLVPGIVMFKLLSIASISPNTKAITEWGSGTNWMENDYALFPIFGLAITLASAYRLAKFNIDEDQQSSFKGLPTPANALMIVSLPLIVEFHYSEIVGSLLLNKWFLFAITIVSCYLLNASINLFALKFKSYKLDGNYHRYALLLLSAILIIWLHFAAIPLIILIYILLSIIYNLSTDKTYIKN